MVTKCSTCTKNITKKLPGLECSRCETRVHATIECAKLTSKQLAALRNTEGLKWSCNHCLGGMTKRTSFFIPEDESESREVQSVALDIKQLLHDISLEIKKTIQEEMEKFETSLNFFGDQVKNIEDILKDQKSKIKHLENANIDLKNQNKNLELRISALEQVQLEQDQKLLLNTLEIAGIPKSHNDDALSLTKTIAESLGTSPDSIQDVRRIKTSTTKPDLLLIEMDTKASREKWLLAVKNKRFTVGSIIPSAPKEDSANPVFIREALTPHLKTVLYEAKKVLKREHNYEYVWCKSGKIDARKNSESKVYIIRNVNDINLILNL